MPLSPARHGARSRTLCLALLSLSASGAWAETSPYYIGVNQAFTHNSNLFNAHKGEETADAYSSTKLLLGLDQPIGRQRIFGDASVRTDRYQDVKELDNTGYSLNSGLDWATIERWSGNVRVAANRSLAQYGSPDTAQITTKNIQNTQQASLNVRNGIAAHWAIEGDGEYRAVKYSAADYANREYHQKIGGLSLRYSTANLLTVGLGVRTTKGHYPQAVLTPVPGQSPEDDTTRRDIDFTAEWVPSGLSKLNARISATKETHTQQSFADVSGVTGQLGWVYQPTGKLSFSSAISRDTGTETTFMSFNGEGAPQSFANNRLTNSGSLTINYDATAKIRFNATGRYSKTSSEGDTSDIDDTSSSATVGLRWIPTRSVALGCNAGREKRTSTSLTGSNYSTNTASCSAQLTLR